MIYNRKNKTIDEDLQYGGKYLNFVYNNICGRILLKLIINPIFSRIYGVYNNSFISKNKINKFIKKYNVNINEYEKKEYRSFNDFFTRKKTKINYDSTKNHFIAPAESKLMVYKISDSMEIPIKQSRYTLKELTTDDKYLETFKNGSCLVFRLSMDSYHRYCCVDNYTIEKTKIIKGKLHTVSSISNGHKIYSQNTRVCSYIETENFGKIICIEVGALLVGKINNYNKKKFVKGEEKGYFELGGSTIAILTNHKLKIDDDIIENSIKGIETKVEYGEKIGEIKC